MKRKALDARFLGRLCFILFMIIPRPEPIKYKRDSGILNEVYFVSEFIQLFFTLGCQINQSGGKSASRVGKNLKMPIEWKSNENFKTCFRN